MPNSSTASHLRRHYFSRLHIGAGLLFCALFALLSIRLGTTQWMQEHGLGSLTIAIMIGMLIGNSRFRPAQPIWSQGIAISKQQILRAGIILYGLRLTLQDVQMLGGAAIAIDALVLCSTFGLALFIGKKLLGLHDNLCILIGAGSSICGAAAIMATDPIVKGKANDVSIAVSGVVLFGSFSMLLYPFAYNWNLHHQWFDVSASAFGIFAGSTIHEVAQVIVAGKAVSDAATDTAVIAKMVRVMMLAPFLVILAWGLSKLNSKIKNGGNQAQQKSPISIPWFAFIFIAVVILNSFVQIPSAWKSELISLDNLLLAMAMLGLGLTTRLDAVKQAGIKPLLLTGSLWLWLISGGTLINYLVHLLAA
jgi:uncharacterized integral membrane protein (TIGR00698 family)